MRKRKLLSVACQYACWVIGCQWRIAQGDDPTRIWQEV